MTGTIRNYLHYLTLPAIAEVSCRDSAFDLRDIEASKIICLALTQDFQTERRFVDTFHKLLFYTHALACFDVPKAGRAEHNLLLLVDECQPFVTTSDDGFSEHSVVDVTLPPLESDGTVAPWFRRWWFLR